MSRTPPCRVRPLRRAPNFGLHRLKPCNPPGLLQESLGARSVSGVSRECPSGCLWGPSGPRDTPRDTPGTLPRHFGPRETPVAGRGGCNSNPSFALFDPENRHEKFHATPSKNKKQACFLEGRRPLRTKERSDLLRSPLSF